jgi:hypothetical protein
MFENMTQRERILAWLLTALVPTSLAFVGLYRFIQKYGDNESEIIRLSDQISDEENKTLLASKANKRLNYYLTRSLAQNFNAVTPYQQWLREVARRNGLKKDDLNPQAGQPIKYKNKEVAKLHSVKFSAEGNLDEITDFLYEFYSLDTLHRIKLLKFTPESTIVKGNRVLTGNLKLAMEVELLIMNDAAGEFDFDVAKRELSKPKEEYQTAIVNRNIFGPPNNTPLVKASPTSSYASNSEVKISLRGEDADKDDTLEFLLLESPIEGARVESKPGSREATLVLPPWAQGTYELKVGVKDSGFPAKESDAIVKVVLKDPPNNRPSLTADVAKSYPPDRPIEIALEGNDKDANDKLNFALAEGVQGAEILQENSEDRTPVLYIPALDVGVYPFRVTVSDGRELENDRLVERVFDVVVERLFSHLSETRITSIVRERTGEWYANVRVRTLGKNYRLTIGDSFEVEKQVWTVREISSNQVVFQVGTELKTLQPRIPFSTPLQTESLAAEDVDTETQTVSDEQKVPRGIQGK